MAASLRQLARRLRAAASPAAALALAAPDVEAAAAAGVKRAMAAGLRPDGTPQTPLRRPRASGNPGPPLVDTGRLLASVTASAVRTRVRLSAAGPGARRHQRERPFLGLTADARAAIRSAVLAAILRRLRQD